MPQDNRFTERTNVYSDWHRFPSTSRFIGSCAQYLYMSDIDCGHYIEWGGNKLPLFLVESGEDVGQEEKDAQFLVNLVKDNPVTIPVYVVLHKTSKEKIMPGNNNSLDIVSFRVKQIFPVKTDWTNYSPTDWAKKVVEIRDKQTELLIKIGKIFDRKKQF